MFPIQYAFFLVHSLSVLLIHHWHFIIVTKWLPKLKKIESPGKKSPKEDNETILDRQDPLSSGDKDPFCTQEKPSRSNFTSKK